MNKIWIIIKREYAIRIKKKSFILLTILMPLFIVGIIFVPAFLSTIDSDEKSNVAVVDLTGKYAPLFQSNEKIDFTIVNDNRSFEEQSKDFRMSGNPYDAVVYISQDLTRSEKSQGASIYSRKQVSHEVERQVNELLRNQIRTDRLSAYQLDNIDQIVEDATAKFSIQTEKWTKDVKGGTTTSSSAFAGVIGIVLSLFIYTFILSYGSMVMQSVSEEKVNRIVEIMVSSVKPSQLMFGKMIGIALVGLTQFLIWALMILALVSIVGAVFAIHTSPDVSMEAAAMIMDNMTIDTNGAFGEIMQVLQSIDFTEIFVLFIFYFIGGYMLFASVFAAIGASINEQQDSQQFMMPIVLVFIFALYAGMFSIENPDGPLALWCSFIPFTSPIVMMVRLPFDVPFWHILVSLVLLFGTSFFIVWLSAKIYRIGILMYGKKPTFSDMMKWIRYK